MDETGPQESSSRAIKSSVPELSESTKPINFLSRELLFEEKRKDQNIRYAHGFFDSAVTAERHAFIKAVCLSVLVTSITVLGVLNIYWGSLWKLNEHAYKLHGIVIDLDQDAIGLAVQHAFLGRTGSPRQLTWTVDDTSDIQDSQAAAQAVLEERYWVAIVVHSGATNRLEQAISSADPSYNGKAAVTAYLSQARDEHAYSNILIPQIYDAIRSTQATFTDAHVRSLRDVSNLSLMKLTQSAPQIIYNPLDFQIHNMRPFDVPVASAVTSIGLIYLIIVAFVSSLASFHGRMHSGLYDKLALGSLLKLRILTPLFMYFWLSWCFALVSSVFKVPFSRYHGATGFLLYWLMCYFAMTALGLVVETLIMVLTPSYVPYFLMLWIILNVSVSSHTIQLLPGVFKFGYLTPFYNVNRTVRFILFNGKNQLGLNFGVQISWCAAAILAITLLESWQRRRQIKVIDLTKHPA